MGMRGDYSPAADQYQPAVAPPLEQALCAWALLRYAQCESIDRKRAGQAAVAVRTILRDLADVHQREVDPRDEPGACAVLLYLAADSPSIVNDPEIGEMVRTAATRVFASFVPGSGFRWTIKTEGGGSVGQPLSPVSNAMLAGAMARVASRRTELTPPGRQTIDGAIASAWSSVDHANQVTLLPWIGWAAADVAEATGQPMAHIAGLREMIGLLRRARVSADQPRGSNSAADLAGGFALATEDGQPPRPTAQSLRPMLWLAHASTDARLVPADQGASAWAEHLGSIRFLMQLAIGDLEAGMFRDAHRTGGGVCTSVWDSRQPLAAQALGLMTAVETLRVWPDSPDS
jgi:hypothetical protein